MTENKVLIEENKQLAKRLDNYVKVNSGLKAEMNQWQAQYDELFD